jgi:large subunit ribosomal protein L18
VIKRSSPQQRRIRRTRGKIIDLGVVRLMVRKTAQHIYAQIIAPEGGKVLAAASSLEKEFRKKTEPGKINLAKAVGNLVATRAKANGVSKVAFDRSGFKYHGRIKAVAEGAREGGLEF